MAKEALQFRELSVVREAIDLEKRTIRLSFSSDTPYLRMENDNFAAWEVLSHEPGAVDTDRLARGLVPVLDNHDKARQLGSIVDYSIAENKAYALAKISRSEAGTSLLNDVVDGIRTGVSVGYRVTKRKNDGSRDGYPVQIATRWIPMEVSFVSVPLDANVGVGRSEEYDDRAEKEKDDEDDHYSQYGDVEYADKKNHKYPIDTEKHIMAAWSYINMPKNAAKYSPEELKLIKGRIKAAMKKHGHEVSEDDKKSEEVAATPAVIIDNPRHLMADNAPASEPKVEVKQETVDTNKIRTDEVARIRELTALGKRFAAEAEAEDFVNRSKTVSEFHAFLLNNKLGTRATVEETRIIDPNLGMKPKEQKQYNLCRAILAKADGHLDGFEWECHREIENQLRNTNITAAGFFVPEFALVDKEYIRAINQRDMTATGGAATGGNFIMTEVVPSLIPLLRNKTVCGRMGARIMGGLVNNINIPRQTGAATATWNSEVAPLTESDQATDHVVLSPNRLGGWTSFSKQLLQQSVIDVQTFVREDLLAIIYLAQDKAGLAGTGPNQPIGVLNTPADTVWPSAYSKTSPSVSFSGSGYPTWSQVVSFEGNVESNNIDLADASVGYVTTPTVKSLWKTLAKTDPRSTSYFPAFFWEDGTNPTDASGGSANFGMVNGYKALASKQVPNDLVIFGKWSELLIGMWGGIDLVVDNLTLAHQAEIRVIINIFTDIDFRYCPAFCYSTNSGLMH